MITKLDTEVMRYLFALSRENPPAHDETAWAARLDQLDRLRFRVLDALIRKPRYSGRIGRDVWRSKANPHRPPLE